MIWIASAVCFPQEMFFSDYPADDVIILIFPFSLLSLHPIHMKNRDWLVMFHSPNNRTEKNYSRF